jgi:hypothetical protein
MQLDQRVQREPDHERLHVVLAGAARRLIEGIRHLRERADVDPGAEVAEHVVEELVASRRLRLAHLLAQDVGEPAVPRSRGSSAVRGDESAPLTAQKAPRLDMATTASFDF